MIEAKLKVPANSLPESQYLLHAGSDRVGVLDIRSSLHDGPAEGPNVSHALEHLMDAAERIEEGLPVPAHLEAIFLDGTALGGARPKASVRDILVSNDDDHLRNHGFLFDPRLPGWRLSPLYDVLPRASHATERFLHLGVGPQGRLATLDNALASHAMFTLSRAKAAGLIAGIWGVVREWRGCFEAFGVPAAEIDKIAPAFRHLDQVSTPALRRLLP